MKRYLTLFLNVLFLIFYSLSLITVHAQTPTPEANSWPMAAHDPQRTSYSPEEIPGILNVLWARPLDPYIPAKVQLIIANDIVYVSTSGGVYALDAVTGTVKWIFATEMPIGQSPTVYNGILYAGGMDGKLYALNAISGPSTGNIPLWSFGNTQGGFYTNPLVMGDKVYAGNRDGYLYAVYSNDSVLKGQLAWKYKTDGAVLFSPAAKGNTIFFASEDSNAYAVTADTGRLVWKKHLATGNGFHSWWPVVAGNYVIYSASRGYRGATAPYPDGINYMHSDPDVQTPGPSLGNNLYDYSSIISYFNANPERKVYYVLDISTGNEAYTSPFLRQGTTSSGNPFPPAVGPDGKIYAANRYDAGRGQVVSWVIGSNSIKVLENSYTNAHDEPMAWALGGNMIYWNLCCDREMGSINYQTSVATHWVSYDLASKASGYDIKYFGRNSDFGDINKVYGGLNGIYGVSGDQNPPIPYKGRVYTHRSNAVIAFTPNSLPAPTALPIPITPIISKTPSLLTAADLQSRLDGEIQKMISAGHLRSGYGIEGYFANGSVAAGDKLSDYFSNPAETIYFLTRALPHVSTSLQPSLRNYIQSEFRNYTPWGSIHIGYAAGQPREAFVVPPEVSSAMEQYPAQEWRETLFPGWSQDYNTRNPFMYYAIWQYAKVFGLIYTDTAGVSKNMFTESKDYWSPPPDDSVYTTYPFVLNAWIAGYRGYMELEKMNNVISDISQSTRYSNYIRLLQLRVSTFSKDNAWGGPGYGGGETWDYKQATSVSRNFIYLTPELADYLRANALTKVTEAMTEYENTAPFWFTTRFEATFAEGVMQNLYDYIGIFSAKALILKQPREELAKYIDVPAFKVGDLFYIQNLVAAIEAPSSGPTIIPSPTSIPIGNGDTNNDGKVDLTDITSEVMNYGVNTGMPLDQYTDGKINMFDLFVVINRFVNPL